MAFIDGHQWSNNLIEMNLSRVEHEPWRTCAVHWQLIRQTTRACSALINYEADERTNCQSDGKLCGVDASILTFAIYCLLFGVSGFYGANCKVRKPLQLDFESKQVRPVETNRNDRLLKNEDRRFHYLLYVFCFVQKFFNPSFVVENSIKGDFW